MSKEYQCKLCEKNYSSLSSRSNHIKIYHKPGDKPSDKPGDKPGDKHMISTTQISNKNKYKCKYCDNVYEHFQSRWRHEQKCTIKEKNNEMIKFNPDEFMIIKKELSELKNQNIELKNTIKNLTTNNTHNINNQLNQHFNAPINNNLIQLGRENLRDKLNDKEKLQILNRKASSINQLVEMINKDDKFTLYRNVYLTNLRSNTAYKFDNKKNKFVTVNRNELLDDILEERIYDIQNFYDDLQYTLEENVSSQIKKFLDRMNNEQEFKNTKKEEIKLILYNNREAIKKTFEQKNRELIV